MADDAELAAQPPSSVTPSSIANPWTPRRRDLLRWFRSNAPGLAPLYEAAIRMVFDDQFPGRVHFVAHAVREIRNRLPEAISGEVDPGRAEYSQLCRDVLAEWKRSGLPADGSFVAVAQADAPREGPPSRVVSDSLLQAVSTLLLADGAATGRNRAAAERLFDALAPGEARKYSVRSYLQTGKWDHKFAHLHGVETLDASADEELKPRFLAFEEIVMAAVGYVHESMDELDEILAAANG